MQADEIQCGKVYRTRRFVGTESYNNDRVVVWINLDRTRVQYDSDMVAFGRKLPIVGMAAFAKWANLIVPDRN